MSPLLAPAYIKLTLTAPTGTYSPGFSDATIPEPEASAEIVCSATCLGAGEGNVTGYKDAEGNIAQRYIRAPALLEWSLPLEAQEKLGGG